MSINVTVNGNHLNIRPGRMVLSDLDQVKKNERDRRRRLRLEQVRQQSKEISDTLLERAKKIAKEELKKIEQDDKLHLKQIYNEKIMEVQQKYQDDMADIGLAHMSAAMEPDHNVLIEEREKRNKVAALKRGKDAIKQVKEMQQKETVQQQQQERLRNVRELEDIRSAMIAKLPKQNVPERNTVCVSAQNEVHNKCRQQKSVNKKSKKIITKKSPGKITKTYIKVVGNDSKTRSPILMSKTITLEDNAQNHSATLKEHSVINTGANAVHEQSSRSQNSEHNSQSAKKESITQINKMTRYNPEDYVQMNTGTTNSDRSSSFSDDSSYFSDSSDQSICRELQARRQIKCPGVDKVQVYDHNNRLNKVYEQPISAVEKIHTWNGPSAIDLAQEIERTKSIEADLSESRKQSAQKRGEDAVLREQVRKDYQKLMQNLNQLTNEERKLKASQVHRYPKDVHVQEERRKQLRAEHKMKLNRALKTLLNDEQCLSCPVERTITLRSTEEEKTDDVHVAWEEPPHFSERLETDKSLQTKQKKSNVSREEQILDMLKKVERQKRLLLQEFGADLPNDIFNASVKSLFDKDKSVQTQTGDSIDERDLTSLSPAIKVISMTPNEKSTIDKAEEKDSSSSKKVETAVQTIMEDKSIVLDKSIQVELEREKQVASENKNEEIISQQYPIVPQITVIRPDIETSVDSISSETMQAVTDEGESQKATPKQRKYTVKARKASSKVVHKSISTRTNKTVTPRKKHSKSLSKSTYSSPKKCSSVGSVQNKKIKMFVDKNDVNIKVKPSHMAEVAVDVSTQSTQMYTANGQEQSSTKSQWLQTKSKRIKIKDVSDTSTSFASPPPIKPKDLLEALSNNISILEMLDSSANESIKRLKDDVSPVSTPETPSPRVMRIPSNIPHPYKLKMMLGYTSTDSQTNNNSTLSSSKNDYTTSTDLSEYNHNNGLSSENIEIHPKPPSIDICLCNNPECKQMHNKFDDIRNYALKNCPQILQKYEDLQLTCAERIVSLTNLIEKVRNEQRGMEFSMINPHDETSLMQLPPSQTVTDNLQSVRKLVENIEAIHNQLAKTLIESQKVLKNKVSIEETVDEMKAATEVTNNKMHTNTTCNEVKAGVKKDNAKPRIINEEKVYIQLNKLRIQNSPEMITTSTPRQDAWSASRNYKDEMIEKISKEILEQSEGINRNLITTKEAYKSTAKHSIQISTEIHDFENEGYPKMHTNNIETNNQINEETKKTKDFIPLLNDIPKISKTTDNSPHTNNGRSKPPVSLLSGPYRSEIESSGHELSTIIEFDTPDTVNKSQNNRSPSSTRKIIDTHLTNSTAQKPQEHVISFFNTETQGLEKLQSSSIIKIHSTHKLKEMPDSPKMYKDIQNRNLTKYKENIEQKLVQEASNKKLQCNIPSQGSSQEEKKKLCSTSIELNKECENNKEKITSSSTNSFSELSGISQIASTPSSTFLKCASSPEEMEIALKKLGLGWAITTLKKTREASALSSSSNSDTTPVNTAKKIISPIKKQVNNNYGLPDFSDVSSISIKEASKSTEQAVLLKGRTSTPKLQNFHSNSGSSNISNTNNSENYQEPNDVLIVPNISLTKSKSNSTKFEKL